MALPPLRRPLPWKRIGKLLVSCGPAASVLGTKAPGLQGGHSGVCTGRLVLEGGAR